MAKTKSKIKQYIEKDPIEQLLGVGSGIADEILAVADSKDKQGKHTKGDLQEGEEINLKELTEKKQEKREVEPGIDYSREIVHVAERAVSQENRELELQLRELMAEIKKLTDSSKELQIQFKEVAVEQHAAKPGKYHKAFFSWLLSIVRNARMKVEDSNAWLTAMHSKKKSREYGAMAKKHGTTFTLNNERTVATQVG